MFERIVCGVDGSPESVEAVRQADVLLEAGGRLVLVAAVDLTDAIHFQIARTPVHAARRALEEVEELDRGASGALEHARTGVTHAADVAVLEVSGAPATSLLETAATQAAGVVAVGTHGVGRMAGIVLGSVATLVLHRAPCSVLVARAPSSGTWAPRSILVGVDGSPEADAALEAARALEARFEATLTVLTVDHRRPARALVEAASGLDLLVVGSRGLHGARALGSVSEQVAHEAPCSVLVTREPRGVDPSHGPG
ncbi:MAG TPA: universal stress protein [Gaiella sp.]|uniref:universal stress protein n=1 Tax=Gaiella sp. TaxID=2663207 RepID=UPI002D7F6B57|nr:universal stress protein [Gaiella sp.]HET9289318.1 universal stress protein [Gaiella sp.]